RFRRVEALEVCSDTRGSERTSNRGQLESLLLKTSRGRKPDPDQNLVPQRIAAQKLRARNARCLSSCKSGCGENSATVNDGPCVGIVELEAVNQAAIDECRVGWTRTTSHSEHGGGTPVAGHLFCI